jgi:hypothetical protein
MNPNMQTVGVLKMEPRWPPILTLILTFGLLQLLPSRYLPLGPWVPWVLVSIGVGSMLAVALAPTSPLSHRIERFTIIGLFTIACFMMIVSIVRLVADILASKHGYGSITLLETAVEIWTVNILSFSLLYWQVDGSRPEIRGADFRFADKDDSKAPPGWEPSFVDYLFLAFATSTSFTPPEYSRPSSHRAKLMLMLQATISLVTLFLIASRAISTLS